MNRSDSIAVLNRLLAIHNHSLPVYLASARPWTPFSNHEDATETLDRIAAAHRAMADRVGRMILHRRGAVVESRFPTRYVDLNDLAFDFLLEKLVEHQKQNIAAIEACAGDLSDDPTAKALAAAALGEAQSHLQLLEELVAPSPA